MSLGETIILCSLEGYFYVAASQRSLCGFNASPYMQGLFLICLPAAAFLRVRWPLFPWQEVWPVFWWPEPAVAIVRGLFTLWLLPPCRGPGLFPSCWSGGPQIHFWALSCSVRWTESAHWWLCPVMSPVACRAGSQNTLLLALPLAPSQSWISHKLALSLRHCFHKSTGTDPLKSGSGTAAVQRLAPLRELRQQLRPWPGPAPTCTCPQSPTAPNTRHFSVVAAPTGHSHVLQVLSLWSQ